MEMKELIARAVEDRREAILDLSRRIHAAPELAFEEVGTSRLLRSVLEAEGFSVTDIDPSIPTAFRALLPRSGGRPARDLHRRDGRPARPGPCLRPQHHRDCGHLRRDRAQGGPRPGDRRDRRGRRHAGRGKGQRQGPPDRRRRIRDERRRPPDTPPLARYGHRPGPGPADLRRRVLRKEGPRRGRARCRGERPRRPRPLLPFGRPAPDQAPGRNAPPRHRRGGREAPNIVPDYARGRFSLRADTMPKLDRLVGQRLGRWPGTPPRRQAAGARSPSPAPASRPSAATPPSKTSSPASSRSAAGPNPGGSAGPTARPTWPTSPRSSRRSSR